MSSSSGTTSSGSGGSGGTTSTSTNSIQQAKRFASSSPWNTPTAAGTTWHDDARLHSCSGCLPDGVRHYWVSTDVGIYWASSTDPIWTFNLSFIDAATWHRYRTATQIHAHAPSDITPQPSDDRILIVADSSTGDYIETWSTTVTSTTLTVTDGGSWATGNLLSGLGVGDLNTNVNAGVRASNFSWAAGMIITRDINQGYIDHALAIALPAYGDCMIASSGSGPGPYVAPATCGNSQLGCTNGIAMGSKIGIPAGVQMPTGLSPMGVMFFHALQTYGAYVGDGDGGNAPSFYADGRSLGIPPGTVIDNTIFDPLVAFWNHGGSADMEKINPLLRIAD